MKFCDKYHLETVPLLHDKFILNHSVDDLVKESEGKSQLNSKIKREGIIIRAKKKKIDISLGKLSFKVINPKFLLKYD